MKNFLCVAIFLLSATAFADCRHVYFSGDGYRLLCEQGRPGDDEEGRKPCRFVYIDGYAARLCEVKGESKNGCRYVLIDGQMTIICE